MLKIIVSSALLIGAAINVVLAVPASKGDKPPIPADLYYMFEPIPDDENSIINWRRAAEIEIPLSDKARQTIKFCWTPGAREPSVDNLAELQNWLRQNKEALNLFDSSLQKPKAQWPDRDPQNEQPEFKAVSQLIRARLFLAEQLAEQSKFVEATKSLEGSLKLAQLGIDCDAAAQIHYLVSAAARQWVQEAILRLASTHEMPLPLLERLLKDLPSIDSETNTYAQILRVDFSMYDYSNYDLDLKRMADAWAQIPETNVAMTLFPKELRRPFKILIDPSLILKHPKPLDKIATIEKDARHYRIFRTNSFSAWTNHSDLVENERDAERDKFINDIHPLMDLVKNEPLPLSHQAAQRALSAYLKIENPVGRVFSLTSLAESDVRLFRYRTEREATRTILALLIFERQKGTLPANLSDMVDAKILDSIPNDPFAGAPISYSRERRIVWSVGEDGVNDDGNGDDEVRWAGDDAVWNIPELN
jgi:hypothetical protein